MLTVLLIGVSLSMDAFAVSVTNGLTIKDFRRSHALWMGVYFGGFQFMMPLLGWILGSTVADYISTYAPYISFALLFYIGVKMIREALGGGEEQGMLSLSHKRLLVLAVATSIDALAVGVTFAFTPPAMGILPACLLIGCTTFLIASAGAVLGSRLSRLDPGKAGIIGGCVLVGIGVKILLEGIFG